MFLLLLLDFFLLFFSSFFLLFLVVVVVVVTLVSSLAPSTCALLTTIRLSRFLVLRETALLEGRDDVPLTLPLLRVVALECWVEEILFLLLMSMFFMSGWLDDLRDDGCDSRLVLTPTSMPRDLRRFSRRLRRALSGSCCCCSAAVSIPMQNAKKQGRTQQAFAWGASARVAQYDHSHSPRESWECNCLQPEEAIG